MSMMVLRLLRVDRPDGHRSEHAEEDELAAGKKWFAMEMEAHLALTEPVLFMMRLSATKSVLELRDPTSRVS
jgi:hypothetical protein